MTDVRGPKAGPLAAVLRGREPVRAPRRRPGVVSLGPRAGQPPAPLQSEHTRLHQGFLGRVIDYLREDAGVRQFVDWGCPVPGTAERVHAADPDATVVHLVPQGAAGMLSTARAAVVSGDHSGSDGLLRRLGTSGLVDFDEPVAVLMTGSFTADDPPEGVEALHGLMRGGGYLALASAAPRAVVERAFAPFLPVEPGVADLRWWPYPDDDVSAQGTGTLAGLGRAPARARGARWR